MSKPGSSSSKLFRTSQFGQDASLFNRFRVNNEYCDVLLASQQEPQLVLRGHRVVLAAVSSVFKRCFDDNKERVVLIPGISYNSLSYVLKLIYEGEVRVLAKDEFAFSMAMNGLKVRLGPEIDRLLNDEEEQGKEKNENNVANKERVDKEVAKAVVPPKQRSRAVPMMTGLTKYIKAMPEEENEAASLRKYIKTDESGGQTSVQGMLRVKEELGHTRKSVVKGQQPRDEHLLQRDDEQHYTRKVQKEQSGQDHHDQHRQEHQQQQRFEHRPEPRHEQEHQRHHENPAVGQHQSVPSKMSPRDPRLTQSTSSSGTAARRCLPFATGPSGHQFDPIQIRVSSDEQIRSVTAGGSQLLGQYQRPADHQMPRDRVIREKRPEQFEWVRFSGCNPQWLPKQYLGLLHKSGCFGFVEEKVAMKQGTGVCGVPFKRASDADAAVAKFDGRIVYGFTLRVQRTGNTFGF